MDDQNHYPLPLLIYDDQCTLCQRFKDALQNLPGSDEITYVSLQERDLFEQFPELDEAKCHDTVHLISENRDILQGPEVVQYLVKIIPGVSKIAWLLETDAGKKAVEFFYHAVNQYRKSRFNSCPSCKK